MTIKEFLIDIKCEKENIDLFLDENQPNWAKFDFELGYLLKNSSMKDGIDNSYTISTYNKDGQRTQINYKEKCSRINTYGNSFTQCHQVSDGETWQEYLAAHLGEPIRNFGIGGYGVFQAYKRMLRHENNSLQQAENIILNIFSDDHFRSIDKWRWIRIEDFRKEIKNIDPLYFHANPWNYLRMNPSTLEFEEHNSICPTPESLYRLCDIEFLTEHFAKDIVVHLEQAKHGFEFDKNILIENAQLLGVNYDFTSKEASAKTACLIHNIYALKSTQFLIKKTVKFCEEQNKKLLIVLSHAHCDLYNGIMGLDRFDNSLLQFLKDYNYIDLIDSHKRDFEQFNIDVREYLKRYYINGSGHYSPMGNHFCAFELKNRLVEMLEPKPITYIKDGRLQATELASKLA